MTQTLTLVGALVVVLLLNAAMVAYYVRRGSDAPDDRLRGAGRAEASTGDGAPPEGTAPPLEADGPTVDCRRCGTVNRSRYRFCRWCVAPLSNGEAPDHPGAAVSGRAF